jgi:hypothetical protein
MRAENVRMTFPHGSKAGYAATQSGEWLRRKRKKRWLFPAPDSVRDALDDIPRSRRNFAEQTVQNVIGVEPVSTDRIVNVRVDNLSLNPDFRSLPKTFPTSTSP